MIGIKPGPITVPSSAKFMWERYRTGLSNVVLDSAPTDISSPAAAIVSHNANASPASPKIIMVGKLTDLHVRVRFATAGATATVLVIGWAPNSSPAGMELAKFKATATTYRDAAAGNYLSEVYTLNVRHCSCAHIFVTAVSAGAVEVDKAWSAGTGYMLYEPYRHICNPWAATVDNTATGKTLAALKGSALEPGCQEVMVLLNTATDDIRFNNGSADANSGKIVSPGITLPISKDLADTLKFFCTAGGTLTVIEFG